MWTFLCDRSLDWLQILGKFGCKDNISPYKSVNLWKEMNFPFTLGFFNRRRNFHSPVQHLQTVEKLILPSRYSNSHTLLGSSVLLSYLSHQQSPAGIAMLMSASKGRESCHDPLGTTVTCPQSQQGQTAELHTVN